MDDSDWGQLPGEGQMNFHMPRMSGKAEYMRMMLEVALRQGRHVHVNSRVFGETCAGGDSKCELFASQLDDAMEAWGEEWPK